MYVSGCAREAIRKMLEAAPPGSLPSLLVGYTYLDGARVPQVDVCCFPPELVKPDLVRVHDGVRFHEVLPDSHPLVADRTLTFIDGSFALAASPEMPSNTAGQRPPARRP
jgi:hypothetical protein